MGWKPAFPKKHVEWAAVLSMVLSTPAWGDANNPIVNSVILPDPQFHSPVSIEHALLNRRIIRSYLYKPLTLEEKGQLLWAAQGVRAGRLADRAIADALYPLETYLMAGEVKGLTAGIFKYDPHRHGLLRWSPVATSEASWRRLPGCRAPVAQAPAIQVLAAVYQRATSKYGDWGKRYIHHMEAGHAAQNVYLQVVSLCLGTVTIGPFSDSLVKQIVRLKDNEEPLYLMPIGRIKP